jgi:D-alanyl-lipoteichoic acid acyltransferase DltB (MBOAT superfamily)
MMAGLKYYAPISDQIAWLPGFAQTAPPGFSFYAFAAIALLIDRYRASLAAPATLRQEVLYLAWFPKILAGPIERIGPFTDELLRKAPMKPAYFFLGGQLLLWGLIKKVVIADNLAPFVDRAYAIPDFAVPLELIIATYFFAFQIYCDFSGYTDMARGISQFFGVRLAKNFNRPYLSKSMNEFWSRRWHLSLASWFRDFVYYPFVGEGRAKWRMYSGLFLVFLISGLWHAGLGYGIGWGFLVWGILNGVYVCFERAFSPQRRRLRKRLRGSWFERIYNTLAAVLVFHAILISWVFFRATEVGDGFVILSRIWQALPELPGLILRYPFSTEHVFLAALIAGLLVIELAMERKAISLRLRRLPLWVKWSAAYLGLFALVILGRWQGETFVYMQF